MINGQTPEASNKDEVRCVGESVGYKTKVSDMAETRGKGALRRKVDGGEHLKIYGVKRRDRDENIFFAWPNGRSEKFETAISGRGPGLARRKVYQ